MEGSGTGAAESLAGPSPRLEGPSRGKEHISICSTVQFGIELAQSQLNKPWAWEVLLQVLCDSPRATHAYVFPTVTRSLSQWGAGE